MEKLGYAEGASAAALLNLQQRRLLIEFLLATLNESQRNENQERPKGLFGKHANPRAKVNADELKTFLHEVATAWEEQFVYNQG